MTKSNLRTGHIVITRNGNMYMVFLDTMSGVTGGMDVLVRDGSWVHLCNYDEDLRHNGDYGYDIVCVYAATSPIDFGKSISDVSLARVLWRREEKKKMTVAEIEKALGYGVEIVSDN